MQPPASIRYIRYIITQLIKHTSLCCRFANPASLNGATSWVFLNSPENIQHVCANNVKNYNRRYLPVRYWSSIRASNSSSGIRDKGLL